jgi:phosphatidylinositol glycan class M
LTFLPQMILSLGLGVAFHRDLPFAWMVQTMAFVTFNKVCTSQYFMWYMWFLPLVLPKLQTTTFEAIKLLVIWVASQAIWLSYAYQLEFLSRSVFMQLWCAGVLFLLGNSYVLVRFIQLYRY